MSRLLVVDDDIQMLSALEAALRRKGHIVETASNGLEAVAKLDAPFQAVITLSSRCGRTRLDRTSSNLALASSICFATAGSGAWRR